MPVITARENWPDAGGISLNIDNSHFFHRRTDEMTEEGVDSFLDVLEGTEVRELLFCVNTQKTSYAGKAWERRWEGYDPEGGAHQPYFAAVSPERLEATHNQTHNMFLLHQKGIDPFARWMRRSRQIGVSPWISMRMGDLHGATVPGVFDHRCNKLFSGRPDLRRVTYRPIAAKTELALDYAQPEVYAYHQALLREIVERYDCDGVELDWSRHFCFLRPGRELTDAPVLTRFVREAREMLKAAAASRGHAIRLGVRVPATPRTARWLGFDVRRWATEGLVDYVVPTPRWSSIDFAMPIGEWREWLEGASVLLGAGLERHIHVHPRFPGLPLADIETVRGAAATFLHQGAHRVYLFNYFDRETGKLGAPLYPQVLTEAGSMALACRLPRRHLVTYQDVLAPGEAPARPLPLELRSLGQVRLDIGPRPLTGSATAILAFDSDAKELPQNFQVYVNGARADAAGLMKMTPPAPCTPAFGFRIPLSALQDGYNLLEMTAECLCVLTWAEIRLVP